MAEQHALVESGDDEVGDLGEDGRGQRGGQAPQHGVGHLDRCVDGEQAERLEVGEDLSTLAVDAELGERHARRTDRAGRLGEQLDRRRARQPPRVAVTLPRRRQHAGAGQRELDHAVGAGAHDGDLRRAGDE